MVTSKPRIVVIECSCLADHHWRAVSVEVGEDLHEFIDDLGEYCPACGLADHELAESDDRTPLELDAEQRAHVEGLYDMVWAYGDCIEWRDKRLRPHGPENTAE